MTDLLGVINFFHDEISESFRCDEDKTGYSRRNTEHDAILKAKSIFDNYLKSKQDAN